MVKCIEQSVHRKRCFGLRPVRDYAVKIDEVEIVELSPWQPLVKGFHRLPRPVAHANHDDREWAVRGRCYGDAGFSLHCRWAVDDDDQNVKLENNIEDSSGLYV